MVDDGVSVVVTSDSCNMVFENVGKAFNSYIFEPSQTNVSLRYLLSNWYEVFRETWPTTEDAGSSIASIGRLWQVLHSQNMSKYSVHQCIYMQMTIPKYIKIYIYSTHVKTYFASCIPN